MTEDRQKGVIGQPEENDHANHTKYTIAEMEERLAFLSGVFDAARVVDPISLHVEMEAGIDAYFIAPHPCHAVWDGKDHRCDNCISRRVLQEHSELTKFEFVNQDIFLVLSKYVEVDGKPRALEMVLRLNDETLLDGAGKSELIQQIFDLNKKLHRDPVTGAYNRLYYEEHYAKLHGAEAVAIIDLDNFKEVNDTYGHQAGDEILRLVTTVITSCVQYTDAVVRYGGDEFLIIFDAIPPEILYRRLEQIRQKVETSIHEEWPMIRTTVSIGAAHGRGYMYDMVGAADRFLYQAKATKNHVRIGKLEILPDEM